MPISHSDNMRYKIIIYEDINYIEARSLISDTYIRTPKWKKRFEGKLGNKDLVNVLLKLLNE